MAVTCTSIFELPASMSSFLFMPMWGIHTDHILCCFGDERCEIVGHIPRINSSAMIAVFVYTLEASEYALNSEVCLTSRLYGMHPQHVS